MANYTSEYYAGRKRERYTRKELILPKENNLADEVEKIMGNFGLSFNGYVVRALEEQIKRDKEYLETTKEEWQVVVDELEIPRGRGNRYRSGYVFRHRPDNATEKIVKKFKTQDEAMAFIEAEGLYSEVRILTARFSLVKEYALLKRTMNIKTGNILASSEPAWVSAEKPAEA